MKATPEDLTLQQPNTQKWSVHAMLPGCLFPFISLYFIMRQVIKFLFAFLLLGASALFAENQPRIRLISPVHDARYITPGTITLRAEVTNADTGGGRVEFYERIITTNFLLGAVTNPPYFLTLTNVQTGFHYFGAAYIDATGVPASVTSFPVTLHLETRAGASDTSFTHQYFDSSAFMRTIAPLEDGSILVGGSFQRYGSVYISGLVKVSSIGDVDQSFMPTGISRVYDVAEVSDGKILVGGEFSGRFVRLNRDSTRDTSFDPGVGGHMDRFSVQVDGSVLVAGRLSSRHFSGTRPIAKINPDDSLDLNFCSDTVVDDITHAVAVQPNGKVWLGGRFTTVNGQPMRGLACLRQDGSIDSDVKPLNLDGRYVFVHVYALAVQADGKLLVGGDFSSVNGVPRSGIFRLNADGSLDEEFGPGPGVDGSVWCFALQSDGKIYVGGEFSAYNGFGCSSYIRLDDRGQVDKAFALPPQRKGRYIYGMALDERRNRLYIGGDFNNIMTEFSFDLACLRTADGEALFSVKPQTSENGPFAISVNTFADEMFHLESKSVDSEKSEWEPVTSWIGNGLRTSITDTNAPAAGRIYRVRMDPHRQ